MSLPLPPLPPAGDPGEDHYRPGGRSIIDLLAEEHDRITALCRELAGPGTDPETDPRRRQRVAEVLVATVTRHLSAEEQYLHPSVRTTGPDGAALADRELAADAALLCALPELSAAGAPDQLVARIAAQLDRHARVARTEVFPALRAVATEAELIRLGNRVAVAEEAAPTRPHPGAPTTPPWNRVVAPAVGVVDKVRDAVTGRPTYLEDLPDAPRP